MAGIGETYYGGLGNDYLSGNGLGGAGDASGDTLFGGAGTDATGYNAGSGSVTIDLAVGRGWGSNAENDRFISIEHVIGSLANDTLTIASRAVSHHCTDCTRAFTTCSFPKLAPSRTYTLEIAGGRVVGSVVTDGTGTPRDDDRCVRLASR